jgi:hypothetical protein
VRSDEEEQAEENVSNIPILSCAAYPPPPPSPPRPPPPLHRDIQRRPIVTFLPPSNQSINQSINLLPCLALRTSHLRENMKCIRSRTQFRSTSSSGPLFLLPVCRITFHAPASLQGCVLLLSRWSQLSRERIQTGLLYNYREIASGGVHTSVSDSAGWLVRVCVCSWG